MRLLYFQWLWLGLKRFYDELGFMMGTNLVWIVLSIPLITAPAAFGALLATHMGLLDEEDVGYRTMLRDFVRLGPRASLAGLLGALGVALLAWNIRFYLGLVRVLHASPLLPGVLAALSFYMLVFWLMLQLHWFPLFVVRRQRFTLAFRNALVLTMRWPGANLGLLFTLLLILALSVRVLVLLLAGAGSAVAVILTYAHAGMIDPNRRWGPPPDEGWPGAEEEEASAAGSSPQAGQPG